MKKYLAILLVMVLGLSMLTACGSNGNQEDPDPIDEPPVGPIAGGWTVYTEGENCELPENVQAALDEALEGFSGSSVDPVAYLGSQVVAGSNYAILAKSAPVVPNAETALKIVKIYKPLDGKAEILDMYDFDIAALKDAAVEGSGEDLVGGWTAGESYEAAALPEEVQAAFDKTVGALDGSKIVPVAYLGSQVVAGANYAVLTANSAISPEAKVTLKVAFINAPVSGEGTVEFAALDLAQLMK